MKKNMADIYSELHAKVCGLHMSSDCTTENEHGRSEYERGRTDKKGIVYIIDT